MVDKANSAAENPTSGAGCAAAIETPDTVWIDITELVDALVAERDPLLTKQKAPHAKRDELLAKQTGSANA